ncbi:hypothetical protein AB6848_06110 [Serratia proteamaculans]|uniref:Uncharacterized protein n=1 Tax=Klebsiella oxytoca TaxID=571 RepID=A0A318F2Q2_KLEOX|nr:MULTISPECIES: hypothetical protein [Enterobacteriaceae]EBB0508978.1 hypothetical protein [Salmonella enterica]EGC4559443.1 hypothetical protein [Escherichia coli]EKW9492735.1 hypothetical protein [Enterobacter hormaechei]EIY3123910.1 hypothetical protein [Escherichia coli]ELL8699398.1 hypothetical protein [Escherichia coli]
MNKKEYTLQALLAALERITQGSPKRVSKNRKLSVRAVEEEANLGNGSCYYYPEIIDAVKEAKKVIAVNNESFFINDTANSKDRIRSETRIKEKYKKENSELKTLVAQMASEHHQLNDLLRTSLVKTSVLEKENKILEDKLEELKNQLAIKKRQSIVII